MGAYNEYYEKYYRGINRKNKFNHKAKNSFNKEAFGGYKLRNNYNNYSYSINKGFSIQRILIIFKRQLICVLCLFLFIIFLNVVPIKQNKEIYYYCNTQLKKEVRLKDYLERYKEKYSQINLKDIKSYIELKENTMMDIIKNKKIEKYVVGKLDSFFLGI